MPRQLPKVGWHEVRFVVRCKDQWHLDERMLIEDCGREGKGGDTAIALWRAFKKKRGFQATWLRVFTYPMPIREQQSMHPNKLEGAHAVPPS